jgi:hypothetical protein
MTHSQPRDARGRFLSSKTSSQSTDAYDYYTTDTESSSVVEYEMRPPPVPAPRVIGQGPEDFMSGRTTWVYPAYKMDSLEQRFRQLEERVEYLETQLP